MSTKTISMCQGKGSLSHNNREFTAKNIDPFRTPDNIIFVQQDLGEAYHQLFGEAVERYNARQKRNDRRIPDYFQHLFNREPSKSVIEGANKQKSFYEHLVYIGTRDDTGVGTPDAEIAKECLREYMEGFQERNPNFYIFNAVMHLDEATPHLHINFIPIGHYKNGLEVRNAKAKALEEMGFGKGEMANNRWRIREWEARPVHELYPELSDMLKLSDEAAPRVSCWFRSNVVRASDGSATFPPKRSVLQDSKYGSAPKNTVRQALSGRSECIAFQVAECAGSFRIHPALRAAFHP